jgi:hypothetical protein
MGDQLPLPLRFLFAAHPQAMGKVLGIVYRAISTHLTHKAGLKRKAGTTGAVTLIQRFGSALNLFTSTSCFWMVCTPIATTGHPGFNASGHRTKGVHDPHHSANAQARTSAECHAAMTWAQRLKRVSI